MRSGLSLSSRWAALLAIVVAVGLLALFLIYSREDELEYRYPAFSTPVSTEKVNVPRLVGDPVGRARDFAWRQALILVEVEAVTSRALGTVVDQFPLPEMLVRAGDTLTVTVSLGPTGEPLPTDPRVGGRVPLRLTPIALATVFVRETQAAGRARARSAPTAATTDGSADARDAAPANLATIAARRTQGSTSRAGATATVTFTLTTTPTLRAATDTTTPVPSPSPAAQGTHSPPEPTPAPAPTRPPDPTAVPDPTEDPGPPEPPTPPPPPPEVRRAGGGGAATTDHARRPMSPGMAGCSGCGFRDGAPAVSQVC